jgi:hypothetical protein
MFLNPPVDPVRFSTSWAIRANILAFIRALFSLYIFASIIAKLSYYAATNERDLDGQDFSYFTSLTFWGLAFYFAVAAFHSFTYWHSGTPALARFPIVLQQFHSIYYSTIVVYPFIVTSMCNPSRKPCNAKLMFDSTKLSTGAFSTTASPTASKCGLMSPNMRSIASSRSSSLSSHAPIPCRGYIFFGS